MKLYKYESYQAYVAAQIKANKRKIGKVWVQESTISKIHSRQGQATRILCHGTRNGREQQYFRRFFPNAEVIGTEISGTANQFQDTVQHDFHEVNPDWVGRFDIVYSNSWDHSYDPLKSLSVWRDQLTPNGRLYLEIATDPSDNLARESDPLEIYPDEVKEILAAAGLRLLETFSTVGSEDHPCTVYIAEKS